MTTARPPPLLRAPERAAGDDAADTPCRAAPDVDGRPRSTPPDGPGTGPAPRRPGASGVELPPAFPESPERVRNAGSGARGRRPAVTGSFRRYSQSRVPARVPARVPGRPGHAPQAGAIPDERPDRPPTGRFGRNEAQAIPDTPDRQPATLSDTLDCTAALPGRPSDEPGRRPPERAPIRPPIRCPVRRPGIIGRRAVARKRNF